MLYQRVQNKKAQYESKQWIQESQQHLKILMNISRFPEVYKKAVERECKIVELADKKSIKSSDKASNVDQLTQSLAESVLTDIRAFQDIQE